jgi:hypothetical protein
MNKWWWLTASRPLIRHTLASRPNIGFSTMEKSGIRQTLGLAKKERLGNRICSQNTNVWKNLYSILFCILFGFTWKKTKSKGPLSALVKCTAVNGYFFSLVSIGIFLFLPFFFLWHCPFFCPSSWHHMINYSKSANFTFPVFRTFCTYPG